jgi:hypothetical protein
MLLSVAPAPGSVKYILAFGLLLQDSAGVRVRQASVSPVEDSDGDYSGGRV